MYDLSQLNDLLVPELLDIADELNIPNSKKLNRQDLVNNILDKQATMKSDLKATEPDKPKRKRILKSDIAPYSPPPAAAKEAAPEAPEPAKPQLAPRAKKTETEKKTACTEI